MNQLLISSLEQGLIFALLAMGVFITNKILKMADLSVEGSFTFGAFIFTKFALSGYNPILSSFMALIFGSLAGLSTGFFYTKLKINSLLSGILTMNILYSVNLRINNKSNIPLYDQASVFDYGNKILILFTIVLIIKIVLDLFLKTELGYLLITTGDNESLVKSLGKNSDGMKILGLMISNSLIAFSGALMAQNLGFADANMGKGNLVVALAAIIIGDTLAKKSKKLKSTTRAILGAIVYKIIGGIAIDLGLEPTDLSAINAFIVIAFLVYNNFFTDILSNLKIRGGKNYVRNKKYS